jgi:hypothetical protein
MAIHPNKAGRIIFTGIFKVMNQVAPKWNKIKDQSVKEFFDGVANPTSWKTFFLDAVATSIQQELILNRSYCPGLETKLKELYDGDKPWRELEEYVQSRVRTVHVEY